MLRRIKDTLDANIDYGGAIMGATLLGAVVFRLNASHGTALATTAALKQATQAGDQARSVRAVQAALDPYCLVMVNINPESRVKVAPGPARPVLAQAGWRQFLVKVHNESGVTAELKAISPNAAPLHGSPLSLEDD